MRQVLTFEQGVANAPKEVQKYRKHLNYPDSLQALHQAKEGVRAVTQSCLRDMEKGLREGRPDKEFIEGKIAYYQGILSAL